MASGLPLVAFDYGAAREHVTHADCGIRVALAHSEAFVGAARELASDPSRRVRMGVAARAGVAKLSPDSVGQQFSELLGLLALDTAA